MTDRAPKPDPGSRAPAKAPAFLRSYSEPERRAILDSLYEMLEPIQSWHSATETPLAARPSSPLAVADELSKPFPVSFTVNQLLTNATDHLHALRELFVTAHAQHIYAPYTLIRSALENATTVLFMLRGKSPQDWAFEALRYEWGNISEYEKAARALGVSEADLLESRQRKTELLDWAIERLRIKPDRIKSSPTSFTTIMVKTTEAYRLGRLPNTMWRLCSAATHGKNWAVPMLAMMDAVDDGESATITGRLMSDEASIRNALLTASRVLERAFTVRETHSKPKGHTGPSFFKTQSQ